ncbi:DUF2711 family protein [Bacillus infantis]|uniref:DUF2711 family protein n=1 Tax=Bacillus infantis TaxID=324767 RepID=UPI0030B8ED22
MGQGTCPPGLSPFCVTFSSLLRLISERIKARWQSILNYLWLDHCSPILGQLPAPFKSCAILLHPFVRMPAGWTAAQRHSLIQRTFF